MAKHEQPTHERREEDRPAFERALSEYVRDPALWPVAIVALLIASTFGAAILLFALRERSWPAIAALLVLLFASVRSVDRDLRRRRLGPAARLVLGLWSASLLIAVGLIALGAF